MPKIQLAVVFGSRSCEHDVSVISALQCMEAADKDLYDIIPVYISRDGAWYTGAALRELATFQDFQPDTPGVLRVYPDVTAGSGALMTILRKKGLFSGDALSVAARIDAALLVLHGTNGEDGSVQGLLELMNVPYTSSGLLGSAVGMDKIAMRQLFRGYGFPTLDAHWFSRDEWESDADAVIAQSEQKLAYPMFVKPANLGSSIGISKVHDAASLREGIAVALSYDRRVLVERGIEKPVEVNCSVLGFGADIRASVCEMPVSWQEFLTFDEKYLRGGKTVKEERKSPGSMESLSRQIPAPIGEEKTERIQALSRDIFRALDCCGVVRIDYMIEGDIIYVGEINTIPGSLAFYLWEPDDVPFSVLLDQLIAFAYTAHAEKNRAVFAFDSDVLHNTLAGSKGVKRRLGGKGPL